MGPITSSATSTRVCRTRSRTEHKPQRTRPAKQPVASSRPVREIRSLCALAALQIPTVLCGHASISCARDALSIQVPPLRPCRFGRFRFMGISFPRLTRQLVDKKPGIALKRLPGFFVGLSSGVVAAMPTLAFILGTMSRRVPSQSR